MCTLNFELLLIEQVRQYPNLYDPSHKDYKDIAKAQSNWQSIALDLGQVGKVSHVKGKWRTLRDGYARARRKMHAGKWTARKYKYFHQLGFLAQFIKHKDDEGRLSAASPTRKSRKVKAEDIDFDVLDEEEFSSTGGLLVPDIILKEEEFNFSGALHSAFATPLLQDRGESLDMNDLQAETASALGNSNAGESSSERAGRQPCAVPEPPLSASLLDPLKLLLWESQQQQQQQQQQQPPLDEDAAFGRFVAAALRKCASHQAKVRAKVHIQDILLELDSTKEELHPVDSL